MILLLEEESIPYHLKTKLERRYFTRSPYNIKNLNHEYITYDKKIKNLFSKDWFKTDFHRASKIKKNDFKLKQIIHPRPYRTSFKEVAEEIAVYFRQSIAFFRTALNMPLNTAPLVEYYGLLQCIKGSILMTLNVKNPVFFKYHGLKSIEPDNPDDIIKAEIKPGVFPALLIRHTHFDDERGRIEMNDYLKKNYTPSLKDLINDEIIPSVFIVSWMLSTLVRYKPKLWQEICAGEEDNFITKIQRFRREIFPKTIKKIFWWYDHTF